MTVDSGAAHDALLQFLYQAPIGLLQTTLDGEITMINPMSAQLLMPFVPDGNLFNLFDVLEPVAPELRQLVANTRAEVAVICEELCIENKRPGRRADDPVQVLSFRLLKLDGSTLVASVSDATSAVQREAQRLAVKLRHASRTDALTSLPNRTVAMERITSALKHAVADPAYLFAVMFVDCDRFDRVNLTFGAQVGDELLRLVGERLNGAVRQSDGVFAADRSEAVAAHLNNGQFVLVLQGLRETFDAHSVAKRVVDALARPFSIADALVHISASVGLVLRAQAAGDAEHVLQCANMAMQEARRVGGGRYDVFNPAMKERAMQLGAVETDLRLAIAEGQLFVVYQPIMSMLHDGCVGAEALVRWRHPTRGTVPPTEFIGIAEETGLIGAIGDFVLNAACWQLATWRRACGPFAPESVSVNVSRAQLLGGTFVTQVRAALAASGLEACHLQLEITESLAAQDADVIAQLHALKSLGITLALDDFGTGYSSLSSLHLLPVDVVKIDRSFVCQVEVSEHHRVLIEATVLVAKSLGMTTVAEGIEDAEQLRVLKRLRCDKGQGYLFSKPMGVDIATQWLLARATVA